MQMLFIRSLQGRYFFKIESFKFLRILLQVYRYFAFQMNRYIIVGQGIAGSILSYELLKAGQKVLVIDNGFKSSSSLIAAGMWNPILFRKLKKSWKADELLPVLKETYQELEELLGEKLMYYREIVRQFPSNEAANDFHLLNSETNYTEYLSDQPQPEIDEIGTNEFGYGTVHKGGYLDLVKFLPLWRDHLKSIDSYVEDQFDEGDLTFKGEEVEWKNHKATHLIYANGYKTTESEFWKHLPLHRTHGDVLTAEIIDLQLNRVFNNGQFLLPLENGQYKIGATFDWKKTEPQISEEAKTKLLNKLQSGLKKSIDIKIVGHEAGIRPTVQDRKPLLGIHQKNPAIGIFNGMGTKGVMLVPFFAKQFTQHLVNGSALENTVDIKRFEGKL